MMQVQQIHKCLLGNVDFVQYVFNMFSHNRTFDTKTSRTQGVFTHLIYWSAEHLVRHGQHSESCVNPTNVRN